MQRVLERYRSSADESETLAAQVIGLLANLQELKGNAQSGGVRGHSVRHGMVWFGIVEASSGDSEFWDSSLRLIEMIKKLPTFFVLSI